MSDRETGQAKKLGDIHKPRGQLRGQPNDHSIAQALFSKSDHEGVGGQKYPKF